MIDNKNNISFFIPAYNCSSTITEAVESILNTNFTYGDELVIVNDFSTDNTGEILNGLQQKYPHLIVLHHKRNKGGGAARNTAVENSKHELLFCLDADNVLEHHSIKQLKDFMIAQQAEVASFHELRYFSESTSAVDETWPFKPGVFSVDDLLRGELSPGASGNYLFTKRSWQKAGGYTEDLGALDTWSFAFKQLMEKCKMVVMPDGYYFHRRGHESYYLRDAWNRRRSVSLRLIKLIINYIDLLNPDDVNYIFSKKGRYSWFDNLKKQPIRLLDKTQTANSVWSDHQIKKPLKEKISYYIARIF